jgi:hypothetical protein
MEKLVRLSLGVALVLTQLGLPAPAQEKEDTRKRSGAVLAVGYGQLSVDGIAVANRLDAAAAESLDGDDWSMVILTGGFYFNKGRTQILGDLMFSEQKDLRNDIRNAPLVGGGTTRVSSDVFHFGFFAGMRQSVWRLYGEAGWGLVAQEKDFDYEPAVINPGAGGTVWTGAFYYGVGARITRNVMLGLRRYDSTGYFYSDDEPEPESPEFDGTSVHVTFLF